MIRKQALRLSNFFSWGCLLFAIKLSFSKRNWKTDIQQGIKAFFRRPSTLYGYCQEMIPNTLILKKGTSHKGKGSGCCQRWQVCFEASSVLFLMRHSCTSPIVCPKGARHLRASPWRKSLSRTQSWGRRNWPFFFSCLPASAGTWSSPALGIYTIHDPDWEIPPTFLNLQLASDRSWDLLASINMLANSSWYISLHIYV